MVSEQLAISLMVLGYELAAFELLAGSFVKVEPISFVKNCCPKHAVYNAQL